MAEPTAVEIFAKDPKFQNMKISPSGDYIAVTFEENQSTKLAIFSSDMNKVLGQISYEGDDIYYFDWIDEKNILYRVKNDNGYLATKSSENHQVFIANYDGKNRRSLDQYGNAYLRNKLKKSKNHILIQKYREIAKLFKVNLKTMKQRLVNDKPLISSSIQPGIIDNQVNLNGENAVVTVLDVNDRSDPWDDSYTTYYRFNKDSDWKAITVDNKRPGKWVSNDLGFSSNNRYFYFLSNHDMKENDRSGLFQLDMRTGKIKLVFRHSDVDIAGGVYAEDQSLIGVRYEAGYPGYFYVDENHPEVKFRKELKALFPNSRISITSYTNDSDMLIYVSSDRNAGEFHLFKNKSKKLISIAKTRPEIDPKKMSIQEAFTLQSRDGLKLYGLLTLPYGKKDQNLPMVVMPHGGPFGVQDFWGFDDRAQLFASRGYAVLQVNYRGSGGYGNDFEESGHKKWGEEMQDDITDATQWAIKAGVADPKRICLYGISYGGYATMQGAVKEPDLYQCAIASGGVYDLFLHTKVGDFQAGRTTDAWMEKTMSSVPEVMRRNSPTLNVDKIKADIFLLHGDADIRVRVDHYHALAEALDKIGKPYKSMIKEGEGHVFTKYENRVEEFYAILDFLDKSIGK